MLLYQRWVKRMGDRFTKLKCKEVINVCDGCRLGFVSDVEVDCKCGRILAIIVPGPCKLFGVLGRHDDFVIPWENICRIGDDIILVNAEREKLRVPRGKREFF